MKQHNIEDPSLQQPFTYFLRALQKVVAVQFLLILFVIITVSFAIISMFLGSESIAALTIAIAILACLGLILSSTYFHDSMRKKSLMLCHEIGQKTSLIHQQNSEAAAKTLTKHAQNLNLEKCSFLTLKHLPKSLVAVINRLIRCFFWTYVHDCTEMVFLASLDKSIAFTKADPLSIYPHASLANCYVMLASHYKQPMSLFPHLPWPKLWISSNRKFLLEAKSRIAAKAAVEELSILKTFAPDELWVHDQLAISYKELNMPEEEIRECEEIIRLCPDDQRAQLRLGILYFQLGLNAKGLIIYERLKFLHPILADELISFYGSYQPFLKQPEENL